MKHFWGVASLGVRVPQNILWETMPILSMYTALCDQARCSDLGTRMVGFESSCWWGYSRPVVSVFLAIPVNEHVTENSLGTQTSRY